MYKIKCDDLTLYNPKFDNLVLGDPTLNLEVNKAGSLNFTIYPNHTYYNSIIKMKSIITVFRDNSIIFRGRVFSDTVNFYKNKKVEVEGVLAFFNDSIVRPYNFNGSPKEYLTFLINQHNNQVEAFQRFKLGNVSVIDNNDYIVRANSNNPNTWKEIEDKLIKSLGGYIRVRYENDGNYIDYLADYNHYSTQDIRYAINLQDLTKAVEGTTLATCIIPYGAKLDDSDEKVNITSVNDGLDYIQDVEAVERYGKIYEVVTWDDVTEPTNLLTKARAYLSTARNLSNTLTIKAVDLHLTDDTIESFNIGDYIQVYSVPHDIRETLLLTAFSLKLNDPSGYNFTLGKESSSFLDEQISAERNNINRIDVVKKSLDTNIININNALTESIDNTIQYVDNIAGGLQDNINNTNTELERNIEETITYVNLTVDNSVENTKTMLSEYSKISDVESLTETLSTKFTQTAEDFNFKFDTINDRITTENGDVVRQLEEYSKYIRFVDGGIVLGESGTDLTTKIVNGKISFLYNDTIEVAYISDNKLYITNAEILESVIIGNYAYQPQKNGSLSFTKVR